MGAAELHTASNKLTIESIIVVYGLSATPALAMQLAEEIETLWNEPNATILLQGRTYQVEFTIKGQYRPDLPELEVLQNTDPRNNYFRIEEYVEGNISFVDGLGCNTGFFKLENLYPGSTTAAHEYGHTLGLDHPAYLDIRGQGVPGIMYPRGTLVDAPYQYDPTKPAGVTGGTMHPMHRRVRAEDIASLQLHRLPYQSGKAIAGAFTNIYHWPHQ
ncbi:MAG TPA: peptidase M10 [Flavisolibacter sp.]|jgi:hypothetical protein|nr:peptidase M10 [Flavisolibacter sp.]